jgi:hypothetical protein
MVSEKWKACAGVRAIRGRCPERSREGGKHERRPLGVNYFKEAGSRQVASGSGNPNDGVGTSSGVPTLQGTAGIGPGGRTPRQMTYHLPVEVEYRGPGRVVILTPQVNG